MFHHFASISKDNVSAGGSPQQNLCYHSKKRKSQKKTKHSAINHLIHFLNTYTVVVAVQCVCYSTRKARFPALGFKGSKLGTDNTNVSPHPHPVS